MLGVKTDLLKVWLDSDLEAHLLQQTRKRQMRRASRGSRPVVVVALEAAFYIFYQKKECMWLILKEIICILNR